MLLTEEIKDTIINNVLSSYEDKIENIGEIFQDSFLDTSHEVEKINNELKDILAKNSSLRKKDFDQIMFGTFSFQVNREKEVRDLSKSYFNEQKEMSKGLRENLKKFKESLANGEIQRIQEFQDMIREILVKQEERKNEVTSKLKEFQKEQELMAKSLSDLLAKGRELRINDLKLMLQEFNTQNKERMLDHKNRKEDIREKLIEFKKMRLEL
ncbi:MAG: hypothetical protein PHX78_10105 [bacterium]|nr:hypothetical protein [bacterium]